MVMVFEFTICICDICLRNTWKLFNNYMFQAFFVHKKVEAIKANHSWPFFHIISKYLCLQTKCKTISYSEKVCLKVHFCVWIYPRVRISDNFKYSKFEQSFGHRAEYKLTGQMCYLSLYSLSFSSCLTFCFPLCMMVSLSFYFYLSAYLSISLFTLYLF